MDILSTASAQDRAGRHTAVERLAVSIGYPDKVPAGALSHMLRVDGAEILCEELDGRVVLTHKLSEDESILPNLASYAVGRMLKEDAVLSWDDGVILWQDESDAADSRALLRLFETFMDSCDWWRARVDSTHEDEQTFNETTVIRP